MLIQKRLGKLFRDFFKNSNPPTMLGRWRPDNL